MAIILSESHIRSVVAEAFKISSQGGGGSSFSVTAAEGLPGEHANFKYVEKFDSVEKAAEPSNDGELVEVVVSSIKWNHTKVKEVTDEHQKSSTKAEGFAREETPEISGSKVQS